jgi:hypothetical protein
MENMSEQQPFTSTQATFVTPVAQAMQYDGAIPRGRNVIRARRVFRATATPPTSPNLDEDIEFVDVIATLPSDITSSAIQSDTDY